MIKFFRHIRRSYLNENKIGKYFKYALGEIILVVIGVLITLQINNTNEDRKNSERESAILQNLLNSINSDLDMLYTSTYTSQLNFKGTAIASLFSYTNNPRPIQDSIFNEWYNNAKTDIGVRFDSGPFDALKSAGLELISNDSLRTAINNAYSRRLLALVGFAEKVSEENELKNFKK